MSVYRSRDQRGKGEVGPDLDFDRKIVVVDGGEISEDRESGNMAKWGN